MDESISPIVTPEKLICTVLEQLAELQGKVYPSGALQNAEAPFSFYEQLTEEEEETLEGYTGLRFNRYRIHVVAGNYDALTRLSRKVRMRLQRLQGATMTPPAEDAVPLLLEQVTVKQSSPDLWERDVGLYRRVYELELHWQAA